MGLETPVLKFALIGEVGPLGLPQGSSWPPPYVGMSSVLQQHCVHSKLVTRYSGEQCMKSDDLVFDFIPELHRECRELGRFGF